MSEVSQILLQMESGDQSAAERLLVLVYDELRGLAAAKLAAEKPGQTLDATALVHEAFVRLAGKQTYADRYHFFRVAAEAMRRILIDRARLKFRFQSFGSSHREILKRRGKEERRKRGKHAEFSPTHWNANRGATTVD